MADLFITLFLCGFSFLLGWSLRSDKAMKDERRRNGQ